MKAKVLRKFKGAGGRVYKPGEVVETEGWLHTEKLLDQKYIGLPDADLVESKPAAKAKKKASSKKKSPATAGAKSGG